MAAGVAAGVAGIRGAGATTMGAGCGAGLPGGRRCGGGGLPGGGGLCGGGGDGDGGGGEGDEAWVSLWMSVDCRMISWVCRPAFAGPAVKGDPSKASDARHCMALGAYHAIWACDAGYLQEEGPKSWKDNCA